MPFTPTVKPGDDIRWAGTIEQTGVTDFTGYVLTSQIRQRSEVNGSMAALQADASITWADEAAGAFLYAVDSSVTATWPEGATLYLDIRVATPDGLRVRTETICFNTESGVTR